MASRKIRETVVPSVFPRPAGHALGEKREHGQNTAKRRSERGRSSLQPQSKQDQERRSFYDIFVRRLAAVNFRMHIMHGMNYCQCYSGFTGEKDEETGKKKHYDSVQIQAKYNPETNDVTVHQAQVAYCHSPTVCPVCGRIIRAKRFGEVYQVISTMANDGYKMGMLTLTASHHYNTSLADFRERMSNARNDMFAHSAFKSLCKYIEKEGHIVATETTLDNMENPYIMCGERKPSGWHYHLHYIFFYRTEDERKLDVFQNGATVTVLDRRYKKDKKKAMRPKYIKGVKQLWLDALQKNGLAGKYDVAADYMAMPQTDMQTNIDTATRYLVKDIDDYREQRAKKAAFELSGNTKKRKFARMKIQDLQYICAFGREKLAPEVYDYYCKKWKEYVKAIHGDRWLVFSDGLKARCGVEEKDDEELMRGENGDVTLLEYTTYRGESSYSLFARQGGQGYILNTIEDYINNNRDMVDFVRLCYENRNNEDFVAVPPASYPLIQDFSEQCIGLASLGYDVEPCGRTAGGDEIHVYLHQDLTNKTCRCRDDRTLPDISQGQYIRDADGTILDDMAPAELRQAWAMDRCVETAFA